MEDTKVGKKRGGGPRTRAGKSRSRRNAQKHGIFTRELVLSNSERKSFNRLEADLRDALNPRTALQELFFDNVVESAWRMKSALRVEQVAVSRYISNGEGQNNPETPAGIEFPTEYPFELSPFNLKQRIKFIEHLQQEMAKGGSDLRPQWEKPVTRAFGSAFWRIVNDWKPADPVLMMMNEAIVEKSRLFKKNLPCGTMTAEEEEKYRAADSLSRKQMVLNLIDEQKQFLLLALHFVENGGSGDSAADGMGRLDLFMRYHTTARRDFYRALEEYERHKNI